MSDLHLLVKSMSKNEKRYFRLFTSSFSNENKDYQRLFDAIETTEVYNEKELKKELGIKHMPFSKKYLFDNILKSLRLYHTEQRQVFQLLDAFKNISILRNKGLIKDAVKIYEKTEQQLIEDNRFTLLLELFNTGEELYRLYLPSKLVAEKVQEIEAKKVKYLQLQRNLTEYQILNRSLRNKWRKVYPIRNKEQEQEVLSVLSHQLLQSEEEALTPLAKSYYFNNMTIGHTMLLNFESVKNHAQVSIDYILEKTEIAAIQRRALTANLSNLLIACSKTKDWETFKKYDELYKEKLEAFKNLDGSKVSTVNQKLYYNYTLHHLIEREEYTKVLEMQAEVVNFWETFDSFLDNDWKITLSDFFAQAHFQVDNYEEAQKWVEIILEEEKNDPKTPSVCNARILNLLIHFKQENYFLLNSLFRSTYRYLNKNERLFKSERLLLNYFKWIGENHSVGDFKDKTEKLFVTLEEVIKENKYEQNFYDELRPIILKAFQELIATKN